MRKLIPLALIAAVVAGGVYLERAGYKRGFAASEAAQAARTRQTQILLDDANETIRELRADRQALSMTRDDLARRLEDEAFGSDICVPTADELRQNRNIWRGRAE